MRAKALIPSSIFLYLKEAAAGCPTARAFLKRVLSFDKKQLTTKEFLDSLLHVRAIQRKSTFQRSTSPVILTFKNAHVSKKVVNNFINIGKHFCILYQTLF
jgi:hypothetical protein